MESDKAWKTKAVMRYVNFLNSLCELSIESEYQQGKPLALNLCGEATGKLPR